MNDEQRAAIAKEMHKIALIANEAVAGDLWTLANKLDDVTRNVMAIIDEKGGNDAQQESTSSAR